VTVTPRAAVVTVTPRAAVMAKQVVAMAALVALEAH